MKIVNNAIKEIRKEGRFITYVYNEPIWKETKNGKYPTWTYDEDNNTTITIVHYPPFDESRTEL